MVDAISGGDIGALPDVTIAESLVRLPGMNGTRTAATRARPRCAVSARASYSASSTAAKSHRPSRIATCAGKSIPPRWSRVSTCTRRSRPTSWPAASPAPSTSRPSALDHSGPDTAAARRRRSITKPAPIFRTTTRYGYRGSGSFTNTVGDNFAFNLGVSRATAEERVSLVPGLGLQRQIDHPANATVDITNDGAPDPVPWGAQTEVKKLTEDRSA